MGIFELGASLWTVLELLQHHTQKTIHPQVDIKYDTTSPTSSPLVLHIRPHLDLVFSPSSQRLTHISLRRLRGPGTVVGEVMRYPGVWFGFEEDGVGSAVGHGSGHGKEDRNQEVKRIVVTQRTTSGDDGMQEPDALDEPLECSEMYGDLKRVLVKLDPATSVPLVSLSFHLPPTASPSQAAPVEVRLGETTAQDLIADIGSPLRMHYKEDDRMRIHRSSSPVRAEPDVGTGDDEGYFYNYFQFGIDFLIDGVSHTVRKVVLHSNVPGSHLFQRYKRCPWEIEVPRGDAQASDLAHTVSTLDLSAPPRAGKKLKKKNSTPEMLLVGLDDAPTTSSDGKSEAAPTSGQGRDTVGLFDKIDAIKTAISSRSIPSTPAYRPTTSAAIPMKGPGTTSSSLSTRSGTSVRSPSSLHFLNTGTNPASPPKMVLDRTSESGTGDSGALVGGVTQLIGFDGLVLEASELGDVLSVVVF